jgi:hypothetical protein
MQKVGDVDESGDDGVAMEWDCDAVEGPEWSKPRGSEEAAGEVMGRGVKDWDGTLIEGKTGEGALPVGPSMIEDGWGVGGVGTGLGKVVKLRMGSHLVGSNWLLGKRRKEVVGCGWN